ncbi:MAG: STAS domain-containing protein [Phycisphaerales bacterium]
MPEASSHLTLDKTDRAIVAAIRTEKLGQREAQIIESELKSAAPSRQWRLALDLSEVTLLASMGLGMLVTLHKECSNNSGRLAIFGLSPDIQQLLKITHLERILKVAPDRDAAVKHVS